MASIQVSPHIAQLEFNCGSLAQPVVEEPKLKQQQFQTTRSKQN